MRSRRFGLFTTFKATTFFAHIFITATKIAEPIFSAGFTVARRGHVVFLFLGFLLILLEFFHESLMVLAHLGETL